MTRYLFVCTGNTCRSPMAEAIMRSLAGSGVEVKSAGVAAWPGAAVSRNAADALKEIGLETSGTATPLDGELLAWADLVLAMEQYHRERVVEDHPAAAAKTRTLGEWAGEPETEIADPAGGSPDEYRAARDEIKRLIEAGLPRELRS